GRPWPPAFCGTTCLACNWNRKTLPAASRWWARKAIGASNGPIADASGVNNGPACCNRGVYTPRAPAPLMTCTLELDHPASPHRDRIRGCVRPAVRHAQQEVRNLLLFCQLANRADQTDPRLSAVVEANFNVGPAQAATRAGAERLEDRFLGRPV